MEIIIKQKVLVTLVEGELVDREGVQMIKSAVVFFKDVFFVIPFRSTDLGGYDKHFNGSQIFDKAEVLHKEQKYAELYDFLLEAVSEEFAFYVGTLKLFRIKVGWGPFGAFQFKKGSATGIKNQINIKSKADRAELKKFYNI